MQKWSKNLGGNSRGKSTGIQTTKEKSNNSVDSDPKESYIHVRARRGQLATNSHSLAERVNF